MDASPRPPVRHRLVVALDGPGSSGKSSARAAAARRLGYQFCDTGLLYRALTWLALHRGLAMNDGRALAAAADHVELAPDPDGRLDRVVVSGRDVTSEVHSPAVDERVSEVAGLPEVRAALLERQRRIAKPGAIIMAGRDIGSVVLPHADLKLYLDASIQERARRRSEQWGHTPDGADAAAILAELRRRDAIDSNRPVAPLRIPDDALIINTDVNGFDETVDMVEAAILDAEGEAEAAPDAAPAAERR